MKCLFLLIGCWLLTAPMLHGQAPVADSLRQLLRAQTRPDTTRVRRLQALAVALATVDAAQAMTVTQQALALARQLQDSKGEGRALIWVSTLYRRQADYEQARQYARQARQLYAGTGNRRGESQSCLQLSLIDMMQGNFAPALTAALQGLPLAEQAGDRRTQTRLQATLGSLYTRLEDYTAALPALRAALKNGEQTGDNQVVMSVLGELGAIYLKQKKWRLSADSYQRGVRLAHQAGDKVNETISEINLTDVYRQQGNLAQAQVHGLRGRAQAVANHDSYSLPFAELALAQVYQLTHQPDSAIALAAHSLKLSQQTRSKEAIRDASDVLAQAYAERGDFTPAYRYQRLSLAYSDTLAGEQTQRRISALRYGFELDKKQAQIALLTKNQQLQATAVRQQRIAFIFLLSGVVMLLVLATVFYLAYRRSERLKQLVTNQKQALQTQRDQLNASLTELRTTQNQLIQKEKMASLGELTAGIAHEIQNPLNFVNNFSEGSVELLQELEEEQQKPDQNRDLALEAGLLSDLKSNLGKITLHGQRAAGIVRSMLEHSRISTGERQPTNLNDLSGEYLRLAYHGLRAKDKSFNAELKTDFDPAVGKVNIVGADVGRVLINLFTNAFYAVGQRQQRGEADYVPTVSLHTRRENGHVEIRVGDNGTGIPEAVRQKIFQPFFTTKPTGSGTGLGLSLSYDLITQGHNGTLSVSSQEGQGTEFLITLPV